eukprot:jgi/Bigna1/141516/aug1.63_g16224
MTSDSKSVSERFSKIKSKSTTIKYPKLSDSSFSCNDKCGLFLRFLLNFGNVLRKRLKATLKLEGVNELQQSAAFNTFKMGTGRSKGEYGEEPVFVATDIKNEAILAILQNQKQPAETEELYFDLSRKTRFQRFEIRRLHGAFKRVAKLSKGKKDDAVDLHAFSTFFFSKREHEKASGGGSEGKRDEVKGGHQTVAASSFFKAFMKEPTNDSITLGEFVVALDTILQGTDTEK